MTELVVVRGKSWKITKENNLYSVCLADKACKWVLKGSYLVNLEEAIKWLIQEFTVINNESDRMPSIITELRVTQPENSLKGANSYVKGDRWRIVKQDDVYTIQLRGNSTVSWSDPLVRTVASYGNIEGALARLIEIFLYI